MDPAADRPHIEVQHKTLLTLSVMAGVVLVVLDATIANVAVPHMRAALGATPDTITWVLTSYIIAGAIVTPLAGWLADRIGIRNLFLGSVALFVTASILCGLAQNLPEMVMARLLQGAGGAALSPLGQTVMLNINRPSEHPKAMSLYSVGVMAAPITGPIVGGWLTDSFNWRWVFLINVPFGVACLVGLWFLMPRVAGSRRSFDGVGWALIALALAALQLLLDRGELIDWFDATEAWIEAGLVICAGWMFCVHSAFTRQPLFPSVLLRDPNLVAGSVLLTVVAMVQIGAMALMPLFMQNLLGYSVLATGVNLAARGAGITAAMWMSGRLIPVIGARALIACGIAITLFALWQMTGWTLDMGARPIALNGLVQGIGSGLIYLPVNVITFASLPAKFRTDAAAMVSLARNTGSSIGIAIDTVLLARNQQISHSDLVAHLTPYNFSLDPGLLVAGGSSGEDVLRMVDGLVQRQAAMISYLDVFQFNLILTLCVAPMILLIRNRQAAGRDSTDSLAHAVLD